MGHDISAFTKNGQRIEGPHFSRFWIPHYYIFEALDRNDGVSGDGSSDPATPESLRRARHRCLESLENARQRLREIEEEIRTTPPPVASSEPPPRSTPDRPGFFIPIPADPVGSGQETEQGTSGPRFVELRDLLDLSAPNDGAPTPAKERLRWARDEARAFQEIVNFIDQCLAEDVERIKFW